MQPDFEGIEMRKIRHKRLTRGAACALMKNKQRKGDWRMDRFDVAAEMIHTVIGSFGLVTVAPFTSLCAGFFLAGGNRKKAAAGQLEKTEEN